MTSKWTLKSLSLEDEKQDLVLSQCVDEAERKDNASRVGDLISDDEIESYGFLTVPENKRKNGNWANGAFNAWVKERNNKVRTKEVQALHLIPEKAFKDFTVEEINYAMPRFIAEVRKQDGSLYPPNSLWQLVVGLQIYLRMKGRPVIFLNYDNFAQVKYSLDYHMKERREKGLGVDKKQAEIITYEMEEVLWEKGILGDKNPEQLLQTLYYLIGVNMGLRAAEHKDLKDRVQLEVSI